MFLMLLCFVFWPENSNSSILHPFVDRLCIDGCRSVDRINCSLVTPVSRQMQSDGYQWRLFQCCEDIVKMKETSDKSKKGKNMEGIITWSIFASWFLTELCLRMSPPAIFS